MSEDAEYRSRLDVACEELCVVLASIGDDASPISDDDLIRRAANKLKMLFDMLVSVGLNENILKAVVRS